MLNKDRSAHCEGWASRAHSEPGPQTVTFTGKLKSVKPKSRGDFFRGPICSLKNSGDSNTTLNLKKSKVLDSKIKNIVLGTQNLLENKPLKVYSRLRSGKIQFNDLKEDSKRVESVDEFEDMDLGIFRDKPLLIRPDASSNSSSSDSEEVYFSDSVTNEDLDEHLQGISVLMGDSTPTMDSNHNLTEQKDNGDLTQSTPKVDAFSPMREEEGIKEGGLIPSNEPSHENSKSLPGSAVEWKKVEAILSQMGLQIIPSSNKEFSEGSMAIASRKKGSRELQNLKFNVNYDRAGCNRGTQFSPMKILSWNIRGSGSPSKRRAIKEAICKANPDIVVLQETKREEVTRSCVGSILRSRFKEWLVLPAVGTAGGILVMWDVRRVKVLDSMLGDFSASIFVDNGNNSGWWFSGVYSPSKACFRDRFWDELAELSILCGDSWCIGGDFNVVRSVQEKFNSNRTTASMKLFDELVRELLLKDPLLCNDQFT